MRIVFIITGLSIGGAEMMLLKVLARLDRQRFAPQVISLTTLGELAPRIAALGIPVEAIGMKPGLPSPLGFFRLVRILKRMNPYVVHTWMYHADLLGGLAARLAGVSAIGWCIRNSNLDKDKTKFSTRVVVGLCALISKWVPSRILSCSEKARQVHVACGYAVDKMVVVPSTWQPAQNLIAHLTDSYFHQPVSIIKRGYATPQTTQAIDVRMIKIVGRIRNQPEDIE